MANIRERVGYYFRTSYRRKLLDQLQEKYSCLYKGTVLDIGGRERGVFKAPRNKVDAWLTADINEMRKPDIVLDVANMPVVASESIDVVNAIELFEHVEKIDCGLKECYRVLRAGGRLLISVPFLYQVHADPHDYQRWTEKKWKVALEELGFVIEDFEIMGRFFTVYAQMKRTLASSFPLLLRWPLMLLFPFIDLFVPLDNLPVVRNHPKLGKYHGGYFIVARKS